MINKSTRHLSGPKDVNKEGKKKTRITTCNYFCGNPSSQEHTIRITTPQVIQSTRQDTRQRLTQHENKTEQNKTCLEKTSHILRSQLDLKIVNLLPTHQLLCSEKVKKETLVFFCSFQCNKKHKWKSKGKIQLKSHHNR